MQVSVPCSSMSTVVTVRCGHCTSLLSVNMMKASFVPLHLLASLSTHHHHHDHHQIQVKESSSAEEEDANKIITMNSNGSMMMMMNYYSDDCEEEDVTNTINNVVNKPPEKRQRTPSAYNRFIKEEIKRLKAENPDMAHKEAFSTAAKNWANFPPSECNGDEEICNNQKEHFADLDSQVDPLSQSQESINNNEEGQSFHGRKMQRNSIMARTQLE
ncbi:hypothetical protein PIB30_050326 [Stylosanthes scabra]|uniref:YABBY transcription factor n=1 Tax=Stylosanthes scabra TaxID=79078 RepID=A0ABU6TI07_9FABA|nr:hypothetical protein [Stylosanthes scabra]